MSRIPAVFWGPPFRWALIPVAAAGAAVAAIVLDQGLGDVLDPPVAVTALKPHSVDDLVVPFSGTGEVRGVVDGERMPIEVRYGVPSPATAFLWTERRQADHG